MEKVRRAGAHRGLTQTVRDTTTLAIRIPMIWVAGGPLEGRSVSRVTDNGWAERFVRCLVMTLVVVVDATLP